MPNENGNVTVSAPVGTVSTLVKAAIGAGAAAYIALAPNLVFEAKQAIRGSDTRVEAAEGTRAAIEEAFASEDSSFAPTQRRILLGDKADIIARIEEMETRMEQMFAQHFPGPPVPPPPPDDNAPTSGTSDPSLVSSKYGGCITTWSNSLHCP